MALGAARPALSYICSRTGFAIPKCKHLPLAHGAPTQSFQCSVSSKCHCQGISMDLGCFFRGQAVTNPFRGILAFDTWRVASCLIDGLPGPEFPRASH